MERYLTSTGQKRVVSDVIYGEKPLVPSNIKFAVYTVAFWSIFAAFSIAMGYAEFTVVQRSVPWGFLFGTRLPDWYFWALMTPVIFWFGRRFPLTREKLAHKLVMIHLPVGLFIASIHTLMISLIWYLHMPLGRYNPSLLEIFVRTSYFLPNSLILYWGILAVHHVFEYSRKYRERELLAAELKSQLTLSQLRTLQLQLNPHFLFNTLNSISALTNKNPKAASDMLAHLSELLRISLTNKDVQEVPLEKELFFLRTYLEIEQVRFQDRLAVNFDIEPETLRALVPSLILQPLVENSIRHGIAKRRGKGSINIYAARETGNLKIRVRDNGLGLSKKAPQFKEGIGLANTRGRLQRLYGEEHRFSIMAVGDEGVEATIIIPFREYEYEEDSHINS